MVGNDEEIRNVFFKGVGSMDAIGYKYSDDSDDCTKDNTYVRIILTLYLSSSQFSNMSITTQALVSRQVNSSVELENIVLDSLRPDEVLVEIHATGVCHTDFACMNGTLPAVFPSVFGHEGSSLPPCIPSICPLT